MRQCTILETVGDALAFNGLLTEERNHLGDVEIRALGTALDHVDHAIVGCQRLETGLARRTDDLVQSLEDLALKFLLIRATRCIVEQTHVHLELERLNLLLERVHVGGDRAQRVRIGNEVAHAHGETTVLEIGGDDRLQGIDEVHRHLGAEVVIENVDQRLVEDIAVQDTLFDCAVFDDDVVRIVLALGLVPDLVAHRDVDRRKKSRHDLLAGPERHGIRLCRWRDLAVPALGMHQEVHVFAECEELRGPREAIHTDKCILDDGYKRLAQARTD